MFATEKSPFFRLLLLVNLTSRPFSRLYGRRFHIDLAEWRIVLTLADRPGLSATELGETPRLEAIPGKLVVCARTMPEPDQKP